VAARKIFRDDMVVNMTAPKVCEVCGSAHHKHQGHVFVVNEPAVVVNAVVNGPVNSNLHGNKTPVNRKKDRHLHSRNEYFREYMRIYRAVKSGKAELIRC